MVFRLLVEPFRRCLAYLERSIFLIGLLSLLWFLFRTGTKPTRAAYPCQRVAAANSYIWLTVYMLPFLHAVSQKILSINLSRRKILVLFILATISVGSVISWRLHEMWSKPEREALGLTFEGWTANFQPSSDIFVVNGTRGGDGGIIELINLMGKHGLRFYKSQEVGENKGPDGLIARDDVVLIKVNSQWDERGGTNTDLLKKLIQAILDHPDGFVGEIVVVDNGQAQYGSAGNGGSFSWSRSNAEDPSQSVEKVVSIFSDSHKVSAYLWDAITTKQVKEYKDGDMEDGYVINMTVNPRTEIMISYPKFKTKFGTYISFKTGIWTPETQTYNSERLKVINMPVLKTHSTYGVTACVKHYMGVVSDKLTRSLGSRAHNTVGLGGMGTEMVETRFPVLNIIDAIWVNAVPKRGPRTPYNVATRVNVIAASVDPVALDYWAARYILMKVAELKGYGDLSSMDQDNTNSGSFGNWLRLSMNEIVLAGYQSTMDEDHMNVYVTSLSS